MPIKSRRHTGLVAGLAAIAVTVATAGTASAYIVCNRFHECWHAHARWAYPPGLGVAFYPETWRFPVGERWHWVHDRDDRGYWRHGVWIRF